MSRVVSLIERLEAAEVGNVYLDVKVCLETSHPYGFDPGDDVPPVTTSLDAALALAERVLPDWTAWEIRTSRRKTRFTAEFIKLNDDQQEDYEIGRGKTPALALCSAILKAKETK